jgi:trk system potassium uptake protein TrkH
MLLATPWVTRSGDRTPLIDALFTAMSAFSVTGLVTVDTDTHWNFLGQLIILVLIQVGGLGFMVGASLILRILARAGRGSLRYALLVQDGSPTLSMSEAIDLSRRIVRFTLLAELVGAILLSARFAVDAPLHLAVWRGIFYSVAAFCNAGFDLQGNFESMIDYRESVWINVVLIGLIQAGALSYLVLSDVVTRRRWQDLATNSKLVLSMNALVIALAFFAFLSAEWNRALGDTPTAYKPLAALFQSVSARTAGFATVNFAEATTFTDFVWVAVMGIGGAAGSTAGGVKLATAAIVLVAVLSTVRGLNEPEVFNRRLPVSLVLRAMAVISIFFVTHFVVTLGLAATEYASGSEPDFDALIFEAMSALATVGLSNGITPELSTAGKAVLIAAMFFGKIGPLTAAYALQRRAAQKRYRFPETTINIG